MNAAGASMTEERVALVSGAASGVGRAVMMRYAQAGIRVIATDVTEVAVPADLASSVRPVVADVRDLAAMEAAVGVAEGSFGRLDIVAAIAGVMRLGRLVEMTHQDRDQIFAVNFFGVWNTVQAALPLILRSPGPRRVLVCGSIASAVAAPGQGAYVASKHALAGLVKVIALEHAKDGVTANLLSPASVATELLTSNYGDAPPEFVRNTPVGRLSQPEEVAALFEFMSGAEAGYITAENIVMDGGCKAVNVHNMSEISS